MQPSPTVENGPNDHTVNVLERGEVGPNDHTVNVLEREGRLRDVSSVIGSVLSKVRPRSPRFALRLF